MSCLISTADLRTLGVAPHRRAIDPEVQKTLTLVISEAIDGMVIDHAGCQPVRVHDGRAHELKALLDQVFADRIRQRRLGGNFLTTT